MRNPNRIKPFLEKLEEIWLQVPDLRFGQLICNILANNEKDIFYIEDEEMLKYIEKYCNKGEDFKLSYSRITETGHYIWTDSEYMHFDNVTVNEDVLNIWLARLYNLRDKEFKERIKKGELLIKKFLERKEKTKIFDVDEQVVLNIITDYTEKDKYHELSDNQLQIMVNLILKQRDEIQKLKGDK